MVGMADTVALVSDEQKQKENPISTCLDSPFSVHHLCISSMYHPSVMLLAFLLASR